MLTGVCFFSLDFCFNMDSGQSCLMLSKASTAVMCPSGSTDGSSHRGGGGGGTDETSDSEDEDSSSSSWLNGGSGPPSLFDSDGEDCGTSASLRQDNDELAQFYADWHTELCRRGTKAKTTEQNTSTVDSEPVARRLFRLGMRQEAAGDPNAAVMFYRRAVHLVPDIEFRVNPTNISRRPRRKNRSSCSTSSGEGVLPMEAHQQSQLSKVACLFEQFSLRCESRACTPADVNFPCPAATLPPEIYMYVMRWVVGTELDLRSLDCAARVCRGWYLLARDPELWRAVCVQLWPPTAVDHYAQVSPHENGFVDWRDMAINRPHVHFNGKQQTHTYSELFV